MKKQNSFAYNFKQVLIIFLSSLATAVSLEVFLIPSEVVIGGALGISTVLDFVLSQQLADKWYFSIGIWLFVINIPFFVYCFAHFNKRFSYKTLLYVLLLSVELIAMRLFDVATLFENLMYPNGESHDKIIFVILGGALHGLSLPMLLSVNASAGGTDIVGLIVQRNSKRSSSDAMRVIQLANLGVVILASVVFGFVNNSTSQAVNMFVYSIGAMFVCEIVQEEMFKGFSSAVELEITTEHPDEMILALQQQLKHGVTRIKVTGGYSHTEKSLILCVINKSQLVHARKIINEIDATSFAYVEHVREVIGKGFANKEIELDSNK